MEKSWENFWTTGKVEDYLSYRNSTADNQKRSQDKDETGKDTQKTGEAWKGF